jgi:7-cyano-7-deazaguanine synthase
MTHSLSSALVLFSGGQDSATCFDYGQRHAIELACRPKVLAAIRALRPAWDEKLGEDHLIDASVLKSLGATAMTHEVEITMTAAGLPSTFVPGRNLLFFTLAGALAVRRGIGVLVGGMCETDYSGYPDCRADTLKAQEETLRLGLDADIRIDAPLMYLDKAATWQLAQELGGDALVAVIGEETHTCYLGERGARHAWGYGCGTCPACELRANGWQRWQAGKGSAP